MTYDKARKVIKETSNKLNHFLLGKKLLETSMNGHDFIFDSVTLLCYKFHKMNFKHGGSYIDILILQLG